MIADFSTDKFQWLRYGTESMDNNSNDRWEAPGGNAGQFGERSYPKVFLAYSKSMRKSWHVLRFFSLANLASRFII